MPTIDYDKLAAEQAAADEIREPGITARRAAARERERLIREARQETERQYRELLAAIVKGQPHDPIELTRLATALGRSEQDLSADIELRQAELADEAEVQWVEKEQAKLKEQIADLRQQLREYAAEANETHKTCNELLAEIERQHAQVARNEKAAYKATLEKNRKALANHKNVTAQIEQKREELKSVSPLCNHVERLRQQRAMQKQSARQRESDATMMPYAYAQQQDGATDEAIRRAVSPAAPPGPPTIRIDGVR